MLRTCGQGTVRVQVSRLTTELFVFLAIFFRSCVSWATKLQRPGVRALANGKCAFRDRWLRDSTYSSWIQWGKDKGQAGCRLCSKFFDITSTGEAALKSHSKGSKHVKGVVKLTANASTMKNLPDIYGNCGKIPLKTLDF